MREMFCPPSVVQYEGSPDMQRSSRQIPPCSKLSFIHTEDLPSAHCVVLCSLLKIRRRVKRADNSITYAPFFSTYLVSMQDSGQQSRLLLSLLILSSETKWKSGALIHWALIVTSIIKALCRDRTSERSLIFFPLVYRVKR